MVYTIILEEDITTSSRSQMIIVDMHQVLISNIMAQLSMKSWKGTKEIGVVNKEMVRHMCCNSLRGYVRKFSNEYGWRNKNLICQ